VLVGLLLPHGWYDAFPTDPTLPARPVKGVLLLRAVMVLEGLLLLAAALLGWRFGRAAPGELVAPAPPEAAPGGWSRGREWAWLGAVTFLGLALRLYRIDADLWLDEIAPVQDYGSMGVLQVIATYTRSNNHLLNTLLVKLAVGVFGESEWAIRLPALLFGTLTVPALYWVARLAAGPATAVVAALLMSVSYHAVFFSQNARGYAPYVLFSLLATGALVQALADGRRRWWLLFVGATVANFASLLHSGFVFAAHAVVALGAAVAAARRGAHAGPYVGRLAFPFVAAGLLGFQLYAAALPDVYVVSQLTYGVREAGYSPLSAEFARELVRGVSVGFGSGAAVAAALFLALAAWGLLVLFRRRWTLVAALVLPAALMAVFMIVKGLAFSPRFLILGLPVAWLGAAQGLEEAARSLARALRREPWARPAMAAAAAVLAALSLASLGRYYRVPKQSYRAALTWLEEQRRPGDLVVLVHNAERGFKWYGRRFGIREGSDYVYLRSLDSLEAVVASRPSDRALIVTTFRRPLMRQYPELYSRIEQGWTPNRVFPATISDGQIAVWVPKR
jgi:hypothetical protein